MGELHLCLAGLSVAWIFPSLDTRPLGQMGQVSEMGPGVLKSKVFALISSRSVKVNQFLEASPFLCEIVNEKAILVSQFI